MTAPRFFLFALPIAAMLLSTEVMAARRHADKTVIDPVLAGPPPPEATAQPVKARPGPWGDLEWITTYLEAPDEILDALRTPDPNPHWNFPGGTEASIRGLFTRAGCPPDLQQRFFDPHRILVQDGAMTLFPQVTDLVALKPEMRQVIYSELAKSPINESQYEPIIIAGTLEDWLRDSRLRPELREIIRKMSWRRGKALAFSDLRVLIDNAASDTEVRRILKAVTRTPTLLGQLQISPGSATRALVEYWTAGNPRSEVLPIMESALHRTGGATLDITHLLPPLPRRRLYTFPTPDLGAGGRYPDAQWTALNFFTSHGTDPSLGPRTGDENFLADYVAVAPPYRFGDMLCLRDEQGQIKHACTYVADDVVFTKNGARSIKPWVLLPLQQVEDIYSGTATGKIDGFRKKPAVVTRAVEK
jgi:hypothetical protein